MWPSNPEFPAVLPPPRRRAGFQSLRPAAKLHGFTLLELLVTVAIVATLATVALPLAELGVRREREAALQSALREIRTALDAYKQASDDGRIVRMVGESGFPNRLEQLVEGVEDAKSPTRTRIYFLRRIPRDPTHPDAAVPAAQTWAQRSYESSPDDPRPGRDIYDVFSSSPGVGLNGIPYRQW